MDKQQYKQQIIKDAKRAGNLAKCGWDNEYDFIEVDLQLLERLAQYARLLALSMSVSQKMIIRRD